MVMGLFARSFDTCGGLMGFGVDPQPRSGVDGFGEAHRGYGQVRWMGAHGLGRDSGVIPIVANPCRIDRPSRGLWNVWTVASEGQRNT